MGNQPHISIPDLFFKTCHQKLKLAKINTKQMAIELRIPYDKYYQQWKWNLYPIMTYQKHLMLPAYFKDQGVSLTGCQVSNEKSPIVNGITVGYEPFIYTLENEIITRKLTSRFFTNKQLWKVMKHVTLALRDWSHAYQHLEMGRICPKNIVLNSKGNAKVVHLFSFPPDEFLHVQNKTLSYSQVNTRNTLSIRQPVRSKQEILTESVRELGITLFCMITLAQEVGQGMEWRVEMVKYGSVCEELIEVILSMIDCRTSIENQQQLSQMIRMAQDWSRISK